MANTAVTSISVQWTPPSAPVNSGQSTFTLQASYNAQQVGQQDVPSGTPPATVFTVAFGSVNKAKLLVIKNLMTSDVDVRINGSLDAVTLSPQSMFIYGGLTDPTTGVHPITAATVTTLVTPTNLETFQTFVFGD